MTAIQIKKQLHEYIDAVDSKKLKAIYTVMEQDIKSHTDIWEDKDFIAELDRRSKSMLDGTAKTYTWEEVQQNAIRALADKRAGNAA